MYKELFNITILGQQLVVYTYAFCIVIGAFLGAMYTKQRLKKETHFEISTTFFYLLFAMCFIGGKVFFYLEKPIYYFKNPTMMLDNFSGGFVFYGSFLFAIPFVIIYFKRLKQPILPVLDILAITTLLIHAIGRIGCFFGGCCYGKPTTSFTGIIFPSNNQKVHPTQLYEALALLFIILIIFAIKKRRLIAGSTFCYYLFFYALWRICIETFRGDIRGQFFNTTVSHAQFISIILIIISIITYYLLYNQTLIKLQKK